MNNKKFLTFTLALAMIITMGVFMPLSALSPQEQTNKNNIEHNIDYSGLNILPVNAKEIIGAGFSDDYYIDLEIEKIVKKNSSAPKVNYISYDNGKKWIELKTEISGNGLDISKKLNKETEIWLTTAYDRKSKAIPASAVVWKFPRINARPKVKFTFDYLTYLENGDEGQWTLDISSKTGTFTIDEAIIAVAGTDKKNPDEAGWGKFPTGEGITVLPLLNGKQDRRFYLVKIAPKTNGEYAPASKITKITAKGVSKPPNVKIDYKKEQLTVKVGLQYQILENNTDWSDKDTTLSSAIKIADNSADYGDTYRFRTIPFDSMPKSKTKPSSAWQVLEIVERETMTVTAAYRHVKVEKGKITTAKVNGKEVEFLINEDTDEWGSASKIPADAVEVQVRLKSGAKFAKNTSTGKAASNSLTLTIGYENEGTGGTQNRVIDSIKPDFDDITDKEILFFNIDDDILNNQTIYDKDLIESDTAGTVLAKFIVYVKDGGKAEEDLLNDSNISNNFKITLGPSGSNNPIQTFNTNNIKLSIEQSGSSGIYNTYAATVSVGNNGLQTPSPTSGRRFYPGNLTVAVALANNNFDMYCQIITRKMERTPDLKPITTGEPAAKSSEIKITASKVQEFYKTNLVFETGENPFWELDDLQFAITNNNKEPDKNYTTGSVSNAEKIILNIDNTAEVRADAGDKIYAKSKNPDGLTFSNTTTSGWTLLYTIKSEDYSVATAKIDDLIINVSGIIKSAIQTVSVQVSLSGDEFIPDISSYKNWITNLPAGLTATAVNHQTDANKAIVTITGTPTVISSNVIKLIIPKEVVVSGVAPKIEDNPHAKFNITTISATATSITINGKLGLEIPDSSPVTLQLSLSGDTFKPETDISGVFLENWVKNFPEGLHASAAEITSSTTATINISGIPAEISNGYLSVIIPKEVLSTSTTSDITVTTNTNVSTVKFSIEGQSATIRNRAIVATRGENMAPQTTTIILINDSFKDLSIGDEIDWITNLPNNLTASIASVVGDNVSIQISGVPVFYMNEIIEVVIPSRYLTNRSNISADLVVTRNPNANLIVYEPSS